MTELPARDEADIAEAIASAAAKGTPLEISGGATRLSLGRPVQAGQRLSTRALSGISLYEPGALTLVVRAGTPMAEVDAALAAEGQMLPFEPMDHRALLVSTGQPTIGGAVAIAASGPRRLQKGACRDSMIGIRLIDGLGQVISNGGRVMKNVTGYDLVKLMAGSWGTLGVLTEISFKLLPAPQTTAVLLYDGLDDETAVQAMSDALGSSADVAGAAHFPVEIDGDPVTMIRLEGLEGSVAHRTKALVDHLGAYGQARIVTDPEVAAAGWRAVRDAEPFAARDGAVWRVSVKPTDGPGLVSALKASGIAKAAFFDWAGGLIWLLTDDAGDGGAAAVRAEVAPRGGHATLVRAHAPVRNSVDVFQPEPAPLARISAGLREKFDPKGILNPGRMTA